MALRIFPRVSAVPPTGGAVVRAFSRGLVAAFAPGLGTGLQDLVSGIKPSLMTAAVFGTGGGTVGLLSTGTAYTQMPLPEWLKVTPPITLILRAAFISAPTNDRNLFSVSANNTGTPPYVAYGFGVTSLGFLRMHYGSGPTYLEFTGGNAYPPQVAKPFTMVGLFETAATSFYVGPDIGWTGGTGASPSYSATSQLEFGGVGINACIEYVLIYRRRLMPSELFLFRENPYCWVGLPSASQFAIGPPFVEPVIPEQTFEDGGVSHPLTWITLTKKDGTKHPYSEVDLNDPPDYYDGYKRPRVERFLTIARGLSDRDGQIEHLSFGAVLSDIATDRYDSDREFRGTLADPVNKYLTNRPLEVWFVDDVERRQLGLPRLAAVGYVNDYAPTSDLHFEVKGADWLKKKFSRKRRAQQSWQPLITAADFPNCPDETLNSPAPLIYGSLGLGGAEAVVGVTVTVNAQPTAAPASFALSLVAGGRLAGVTRYYKVSGIVGGQETIQAGPLVATTTDANKTIRLTWTTVPSATAIYVYSSHRPDFLQFAYVLLAGGATSYNDTTTPPNQDKRWLEGTDWILGLRINLQYYVYANLGGGVFSEPGQAGVTIPPNPPKTPAADLDRNIAIAWTAHAGASGGYRIIRRKSYYSDWDAVFDRQWDVAAGVLTVTDDLITTTAVTMPSGELIAAEAAGQAEAMFVGVGSYGTSPQTLSALLVARHACARLGKIYIPQTIANVDGENETTYTPVPESAFGVTWFAPDHPGWIYPNKYVEINGQWFTLIFTTVEPLPEKVLVDVDGIEPDGDGTGDVIRSLVDQRLHFMVNFVAPDPAWASGPYLTAADTVFPHIPAIPLVDEDSHVAVKAALAARLVSGDYEGAMILGADGEFVTATDALARFQLSGDFDQTFNRKGQDMVTCEPIEAGTDLPTITDVLSIREGSFNLVDQVQSAFFNIIPYVHSRDYTGRERTGWYGNNEIRAEDSILNYDQEREAPVFELHAGRANTPQGSATIADVMARKLARYQDPRRIGSLQMPFEGLEYEPGSTAAITHIEGIGADGWAGREVRFIRHEVEPTTGIVRLDFYDLTAVLENHEAIRRRREGGE